MFLSKRQLKTRKFQFISFLFCTYRTKHCFVLRGKLQSYYEAFVQLEKENYILKQNVQEFYEKLKKHEERHILGDKTNLTSGSITPTKKFNEVTVTLGFLVESNFNLKLTFFLVF